VREQGMSKHPTLFDFIDDDLPYYDHELMELRGSQISKARKLNQLGKVRKIDSYTWLVLPIEGYNTRTYTIVYDGEKLNCNCQYNATKGKTCSHILAVLFYEGKVDPDEIG